MSSPENGDNEDVPNPRTSTDKRPVWETLRYHPALRATSNQHNGPAVTERLIEGNESRFTEESVAGSAHEIRPESLIHHSSGPSWCHDW